MKLLFVVPTLPYPPRTGSTLITYNRIKYLARRHTIDLIAFKGEETSSDRNEVSQWCNSVTLIDRPSRWQGVLNKGLGAIFGWPIFVSYYRSNKMKEAVEAHLGNGGYDVAVFQQTEMAQFHPDWYKGASILSMENPMVINQQRLAESSRSWRSRFRSRNRIARLTRYERRQAPLFNRVLLINEADVESCRRVLPNIAIDWVPHGIDVSAFQPSDPTSRIEGMIVITGNMYHPPNIEGVEYFCREVLPLVAKRVPSANLWLVGAGPVEAVKRLGENDRIKVTGFVPDMRTYLVQAKVSVCPIRLKIGTQTKILEALACGTPVVTTSAGNNGIGGVSGDHLYVADHPSEMADRVGALLEGERWTALSENGRQFVVNNFAWEKGVSKFEYILGEVLRESSS